MFAQCHEYYDLSIRNIFCGLFWLMVRELFLTCAILKLEFWQLQSQRGSMSELIRMSFSVERELYQRVEKAFRAQGYSNRSEFVRDVLRDKLVEGHRDSGQEVLGTIMLVYDHHIPTLTRELTRLQHDHEDSVLATTHLHVTHDVCAEMIMVKGEARHLNDLVNSMRRLKGVFHSTLSISSVDLV